jgi:Kef-type K+ transport system membrane component KefB
MNIVVLIVIFLLMFFLKSPLLAPFANTDFSTTLALGFLLIFSFLIGKRIKRLNLPQITGFILAGILCGPFVMKFLSRTDVNNLQLLDGLALSLIALTAGGEMRLTQLKRDKKAITSILFFQTVIIISGFVVFGFLSRPFFPFFSEVTLAQGFAISLLLGTLATATSPSTTIAVMTELNAKGRYTDLILSTSVVKDFVVICLFAFSLSAARAMTLPDQAFNSWYLGSILEEVGVSVLVGAAIGGGIILFLKFIKKETAIFILGIAFLTYQISRSLGYHPLLICLVAGFFVENFSSRGESLIQAIEKVSVPIYVVFFTISGAALNLDALGRSWVLALVYVVLRAALKYSGTYVGARIVNEEEGVRKQSWKGFISQAGVALGMAIIIEETFPEWGGEFKALVLAFIAINQVIGPVLLQKLLVKVNEAGKKA